MAEIEAFRITIEEHAQANDELRKSNEELRRSLHRQGQCPARERSPDLSLMDDSKSFSQQIMDELVSPYYIVDQE